VHFIMFIGRKYIICYNLISFLCLNFENFGDIFNLVLNVLINNRKESYVWLNTIPDTHTFNNKNTC